MIIMIHKTESERESERERERERERKRKLFPTYYSKRKVTINIKWCVSVILILYK